MYYKVDPLPLFKNYTLMDINYINHTFALFKH
jgi:hypothetical protein